VPLKKTVMTACALAFAAAFAMRAGAESCKSVGNTRLPSPDGRHEVLLFVRVCGEQASGEVEIVAKGGPVPDRAGNVDVPGHPIRVSARWDSNDVVLLEIPGTGPLPKPVRVEGVTITFFRLSDPRSPD